MKSLVIAALIVLPSLATAQSFSIGGGTPGIGGLTTKVPGGSALQCVYTGRNTALCSCNNEPSQTHTQACLQVLRDNCGRVTNGEALCPVDPA